jgi:hypothetical protein
VTVSRDRGSLTVTVRVMGRRRRGRAGARVGPRADSESGPGPGPAAPGRESSVYQPSDGQRLLSERGDGDGKRRELSSASGRARFRVSGAAVTRMQYGSDRRNVLSFFITKSIHH